MSRPEDQTSLLPWRGVKTKTSVKMSDSEKSVVHGLYTITDDSLPSHMRSILPSHDLQVNDILTLERTRRKLRCVIMTLTGLLVVTVIVVVVLTWDLRMQLSTSQRTFAPNKMLHDDLLDYTRSDEHVVLLNSGPATTRIDVYGFEYEHADRTPCVSECWSFAAFRFQSTCQDGFCRCHGDLYDPDTCLPRFKGCHIRRKSARLGHATLLGKNQTSYVCSQEVTSLPVYVISVFGNHHAPATRVQIRGHLMQGSSLLLVTYYPVSWEVRLQANHGISHVILVTASHKPETRVTFQGTEIIPQVSRRVSLTGYGDDQHGGYTPELLQLITAEVGDVTTFIGASHADQITLDLSHEEKPHFMSTD